MQSMRGIIEANLKPDQKMPPLLILIVVSSLQATVLVAIAAAIGVSTSSVTGLSTPFLTSLLSDGNILEPLKQQLIAGVIGGMVCSAIFLPLYYVYFRPRLEVQTVQITENLRKNLSLSSKLLYGGIYEEVLVRWGLMGLWLLLSINSQFTCLKQVDC